MSSCLIDLRCYLSDLSCSTVEVHHTKGVVDIVERTNDRKLVEYETSHPRGILGSVAMREEINGFCIRKLLSIVLDLHYRKNIRGTHTIIIGHGVAISGISSTIHRIGLRCLLTHLIFSGDERIADIFPVHLEVDFHWTSSVEILRQLFPAECRCESGTKCALPDVCGSVGNSTLIRREHSETFFLEEGKVFLSIQVGIDTLDRQEPSFTHETIADLGTIQYIGPYLGHTEVMERTVTI